MPKPVVQLFSSRYIAGSSLADAVAIGDAPNDVELLRAAGYAVAVASSRPEVIAAADVTCAPPEEGGVADVLAELGLL